MANSYKPFCFSKDGRSTSILNLFFYICIQYSQVRIPPGPKTCRIWFSHLPSSFLLNCIDSSFALYNALPLPTPAYPPSLIFLAVYPSLPLIALFPYLNLYFFSLSHFFLSTGTSFPLPYKLQGLYPPSSSQGCYLRLVYREFVL